MSKRNSSKISSDPQEESSTPKIKELTVQEFIGLKNWELANHVADEAYSRLFPDLDERYDFMTHLKEFHQICVAGYERIEREKLPKNRSLDPDLFKQAQEWRKNILAKSKNGSKFLVSNLEERIRDLEEEIDQREEEPLKEIDQREELSKSKKQKTKD